MNSSAIRGDTQFWERGARCVRVLAQGGQLRRAVLWLGALLSPGPEQRPRSTEALQRLPRRRWVLNERILGVEGGLLSSSDCSGQAFWNVLCAFFKSYFYRSRLLLATIEKMTK